MSWKRSFMNVAIGSALVLGGLSVASVTAKANPCNSIPGKQRDYDRAVYQHGRYSGQAQHELNELRNQQWKCNNSYGGYGGYGNGYPGYGGYGGYGGYPGGYGYPNYPYYGNGRVYRDRDRDGDRDDRYRDRGRVYSYHDNGNRGRGHDRGGDHDRGHGRDRDRGRH